MKSLRYVLSAGVLATTILTAQARIDRVIEKTFAVSGPGTLKVDAQGGAIKVTSGPGSAVKITAKQKIRADTDAEADEILRKLEFTMDQSGNDVTIVSKYERSSFGFHWGSWPPVTVAFEIAVPASYATDLHTAGGGITLDDLQGAANLSTAGGSITLGKLGGSVRAHTAGGSVRVDVDETAAFQLDASTSDGRVKAEGLTLSLGDSSRGRLAGAVNGGGPLLKLRTVGGGIDIRTH